MTEENNSSNPNSGQANSGQTWNPPAEPTNTADASGNSNQNFTQYPQQSAPQYPQPSAPQYPQQNAPQYPQQNAPQYSQQNAPQYSQQPGYGYGNPGAPMMQPGPVGPSYSGYGVPIPPGYKTKSKIAAALLAFFFGGLGLHNFYLGNNGRGAAQLALNALGWLTFIFVVGFVIWTVLAVWYLAEFVMILIGAGGYDTDSMGVPLD